MDRASRIIIIICMLFLLATSIFIGWIIFSKNRMDLPFILLLNLIILGMPLFLTIGIFSVYRRFYLSEYPERTEHVNWNNYVLPMTIFITFSLIITAGLIFRDSKASVLYADRLSESQQRDIAPSFLIGRSSIPINLTLTGYWTETENGKKYVIESETIRFPTTIFWFAYIGALVGILGTIMRRLIIKHLVARTYLHSTVRIFYAMIATALFYIFVQVWPEVLGQSKINPLEKSRMLILFAFLAGLYPWETIRWVTERLRNKLGFGGRELLPLTEIQGIDPEIAIFLNEEGIWSVTDLAARSPRVLARNAHLDQSLVRNWHNQAKLLVELGEQRLINQFRQLGINDWSDLSILPDVEMEIKLEDLTKLPNEPNEISPVLFQVLKKKFIEDSSK